MTSTYNKVVRLGGPLWWALGFMGYSMVDLSDDGWAQMQKVVFINKQGDI